MNNLFERFLLFDKNDGAGNGADQEPTQEPTQDPAQDPAQDQEPTGPMIPKQRFDVVNTENQELKKRLSALEEADKKRKEQELTDREEFKTLAEQRAQEIKQKESENMRLRVAMSKGIPVEFVDRLKGDTLEEITQDAESLLPFLQQQKTSSVPPLKQSGQQNKFDLSNATPAEIREQRRKGKLPIK